MIADFVVVTPTKLNRSISSTSSSVADRSPAGLSLASRQLTSLSRQSGQDLGDPVRDLAPGPRPDEPFRQQLSAYPYRESTSGEPLV